MFQDATPKSKAVLLPIDTLRLVMTVAARDACLCLKNKFCSNFTNDGFLWQKFHIDLPLDSFWCNSNRFPLILSDQFQIYRWNNFSNSSYSLCRISHLLWIVYSPWTQRRSKFLFLLFSLLVRKVKSFFVRNVWMLM